jgi:hypothetical protein
MKTAKQRTKEATSLVFAILGLVFIYYGLMQESILYYSISLSSMALSILYGITWKHEREEQNLEEEDENDNE